MTGLTIEAVASAVARAKAAMPGLEQELNEADSRLGDGDTGSMLARVLDRLAETDLSSASSLSDAFSKLARSAMGATGSSLGTLFATALMTAAKLTRDKNTVEWSELGPILTASRDAMMARGGAKLGDKTVLDAIDAVARSLEGLSDQREIATSAREAAEAALSQFLNESCKMGRARMFAEKSVGVHDPGMLAFAKLTHAVAQ
jgi:dihydroxyacetone kinase